MRTNWNTGYFFFSKSQYNADRERGDSHAFCVLDNGNLVEYTEWRETSDQPEFIEDSVLLGHGKFDHAESEQIKPSFYWIKLGIDKMIILC